MRARRVALVVVGSLLVACSPAANEQAVVTVQTPPSTTTVPVPDWLGPGVEFFDALGESVDRGDVPAVLGFYQPDAEVIDANLGYAAFGWRQISALLGDLEPPGGGSGGVVLINELGALVLSDGGDGCGFEGCPEAFADLFFMDEGRIGSQVRAHSIDAAADPGIVDLYVGTAAAYSAHDVDALVSYHSDAAFAPAPPREEYESTFASMPEISAEPATLSELGVSTSAGPATFTAGPVSGDQPSRSETVIGIYRLSIAPGLDTLAATVWDLWDGEILRTLTYFDPIGWGRIVESWGVGSPTGWFATVELPQPVDSATSSTVDLGDGAVVTVHGGSEDTLALVTWAFGRFEAAGLAAPRVAAIHFEHERTCLEGMGWARAEVDEPEIRICLEDDELTSDDGASRAGEVTVLHELAHVWTAQHVTAEVRAEFLAFRDLGVWSDHAVPWSERGTEHASEMLAWGLGAESYEVVRLGSPSCEELIDGFRILTGTAPLHGCLTG